MRSPRSFAAVSFAAVLILLSCAVQSTEDGEKEGLEIKAAAMLADEERNEEMIHKEAMRLPQRRTPATSDVEDNDPTPPWEADQKAKSDAQEVKNAEARVAARIAKVEAKQNEHGDLGESGPEEVHHSDLGESAEVTANAANTMTVRAHEKARAYTQSRMKNSAMHRAKQIADKVRKLVSQQQKFEHAAGQKVKGSLLAQATSVQNEAAQRMAHDSLLEHKLENEQAMDTMQHLMETERDQQHKAFERERSSTHEMLQNLRTKLKAEQSKMVKQIRTETTDAVVNVEKELSKSAIASTIQKVVQKNVAKRVAELKAMGEKTVHSVASQVQKLKHRVRRLRREQERMKVAEASLEQKTQLRALGESHSHRDLGESVGMNPLTLEMEKMRMEQMMQRMQQQPTQIMPQSLQQQEQQQQQSAFQMEEHKELLEMKQQMQTMKDQNARLTQMLMSRNEPVVAPQHYSHHDLANFFQKKRKKNTKLIDLVDQQLRSPTRLHDQIAQEKARLQHLTQLASSASSIPGAAMLVELSEGEQDHALPIYNQHAEQARVEMEELQQRALADSLSTVQDSSD